ncbi:RAS GTPase-activating protein [Mycena indigotica]|uniref:RAS GTPase-activating protein n=1 Tax=Mycena indigotica TaxID=2126181 RepID=A0A8H6SMQ4_9AGAR|nr:RAS GTPase-activating protein [Mycena indigotica]KAF7301657.1 RAS GTPase-activating protein [Mycena indigotica]
MDGAKPSKAAHSNAPPTFGYQTRLLERTASQRSGNSLLSRSNSQSGMGILSQPTGSSTASATRRWTPSHRVTNSLDAVRGKWEEKARETNGEEPRVASPTSLSRVSSSSQHTGSSTSSGLISPTGSISRPERERRPPSPDSQRTPTFLKRHTMPAPIIATPLSPNTTGVSVEADFPSPSFTTPTPNRIHLPSPTAFPSTTSVSSSRDSSSSYAGRSAPKSVRERAQTLNAASTGDNAAPNSPPPRPTSSFPSPMRRPTSLYGSNHSAIDLSRPPSTMTVPPPPQILPAEASSVMSPPSYRSSYMNRSKASTYGDHLVVGRKLGRHLPRIASGDGEEDRDRVMENQERESRESRRVARLRRHEVDFDIPQKSPPPDIVVPGPSDVTGVPGRLRLSKNAAPVAPSSPLPSARLTRGLWADTQRHLIQAYEYLCHVGEAQQWIEGCLNEELEFGVVELEDGLRNGVILAKLVRVFRPAAAKKIYDAPKLDFRHSDNINYFFNFVREVGLPEGFIFELTDLYDKKNLPKVIYCIHALSHLLARRGMAQRIGNLLGHLKFSDDQLQRTQKGLKDAGVLMPNFGNVGKELAREINEPEEDIETEEERRDRLLLDRVDSIIGLQAHCRRELVQRAQATQNARIHLHLPPSRVTAIQAVCRGVLIRRRIERYRRSRQNLTPWAIALQAAGRGLLVRRRWHARLARIHHSSRYVVKIQAQLRGVLTRRRYHRLKAVFRSSAASITKLQSLARASLARQRHRQVAISFQHPHIRTSIVAFQATLRGLLARRRAAWRAHVFRHLTPTFIRLQAHCRGVIIRRRMRNQQTRLRNTTATMVQIQAAARTFLARKRLLNLIRGLRTATPVLVGIQAIARARLAQQRHQSLNVALSQTNIVTSIGGFQARARASIARNKHRQLQHTLGFVAPDVVGLQAACRRALVLNEYRAWRDHLRNSHPIATLLQAMLRGTMQRKNFRSRMNHYRANLSKLVQIQSFIRAKETREQYRQLTLGTNVSVGTIKNFVHLLDDSEGDFQEEVKVERLRKQVVEAIRENQVLENELSDLDVKIALFVRNRQNVEEVLRTRRLGADSAAARAERATILAAHGDPFSGPHTIDLAARRKLELYQQLFYLLQTRGEYLSRLFVRMSVDAASENNRRFTERVVLTLFGFGQDRREDFLLLKLFQLAIHQEIQSAGSIHEIIHGHPVYLNIAVPYLRRKQAAYVRETFQQIIMKVVDPESFGEPPLDLEIDPSKIHLERGQREDLEAGVHRDRKPLNFHEALQDGPTRAAYIRGLQSLQHATTWFLDKFCNSVRRMPFSTRYLARETLNALHERFPGEPDSLYAACIGRLVYYRCINPAIVAPETYDMVPKTVDLGARKNLEQVSKVLTQIVSGSEFDEDTPQFVPINELVRTSIVQMTTALLDVANVPDAETFFHAHEFLDATVQPKPIYISPNEIYTIHGLLLQHQNVLAPEANDVLRTILSELGGVPNLGSDELKDAREHPVTLELTNRFADVDDTRAEENTLWVKAKRGVLAVLRVHPAQSLAESLLRKVTEEDVLIWDEILDAEAQHQRAHNRRQPSNYGGDSYKLDDFNDEESNFHTVKANAIAYLLKLEKMGKVSRDDGFQGILNAIALDVRSKHRKRVQRQQEMESMQEALKQLAKSKKQLEEQIQSYHSYAAAAMQNMQQNAQKKRWVVPFTKQFFHLRDLQRSGEKHQHGSFIYTAKYLYEKGILLSIEQYSPRQFDKLNVIMASDKLGVFAITLESNTMGIANRIGSEDVRMEDLLQAKFESRQFISLIKGKVKVNLERFLFQINKKFYV